VFLIVENFYDHPLLIRNYAVTLPFDVTGNYPGYRTKCLEARQREKLKVKLEGILKQPIIDFPDLYNTSFQYTTKDDKSWVHHDETTWAGIVYLTPDAPLEAGTGIYRHKNSRIFAHNPGQYDYNNERTAPEDWELVAFAGNVFNRLVLYRGNYYHKSAVAGFGDSLHNGRLFQTFFFDT
jgi:hypothetical protein